MDLGHFKELLWLCFLCQTFFPIIFMVENVYILIFEIKKIFCTFSKDDFAHF